MAFNLQSFSEGFQDTILKTAVVASPLGGSSQVTPATGGYKLPPTPSLGSPTNNSSIPKPPSPPKPALQAPPLPKMPQQNSNVQTPAVTGQTPYAQRNLTPTTYTHQSQQPVPNSQPTWHSGVAGGSDGNVTDLFSADNLAHGMTHSPTGVWDAVSHPVASAERLGGKMMGYPAVSEQQFQQAKAVNENLTPGGNNSFSERMGNYDTIAKNLGPTSNLQQMVNNSDRDVQAGTGLDVFQHTGMTSADPQAVLQKMQTTPGLAEKMLQENAKIKNDPGAYQGKAQTAGWLLNFVRDHWKEILAVMGGAQALHYLSQMSQNTGNQGVGGAVQGATPADALPTRTPFAFKTDNEQDMA